MIKKKPYKPPYKPKGKQNLDDPMAQARLEAYNARVQAQNVVQMSQPAISSPVNLGAMAAAGGQFTDTSARPGYQNTETGAFSGMLQRSISRPLQENVVASRIGERLMNKPKTLAALAALKKKGYKSYTAGSTTPTVPTTVVPQRIR